MGSKSGDKIEVFDYQMSMHVGICAAGDGLELLALKYGDKEIWRGAASDPETLVIDKPDLFGGRKKEGGVGGNVWWLPGKSDQTMPNALATRMGKTTATCPGFRGLASAFFTAVANVGGFWWGTNNPYLRAITARVRRPSVGLDPDIALIRMPDDSQGNQQWASNPAHMIYECLTDTDWGMGESPTLINKQSFEDGAQTLYDEGFGLCMIWTRQSSIENFIGEILNHIQGALYVDPATGKHTFKLLRADYDVDALPVIDPGNAVLSSFKRKVWGEIANEVVVTYTNPESGKEATVTGQDLAGIAAEGGVISASQNYYGVVSQALAITLAERDLAAMVNPIATCEATVTREFWNTVSSNVVLLSWPEYNIDRIVFRVSVIDKGPNTVTLNLYEDIFGLDHASYLEPGETEWVNPSQPPEPVIHYQMGTAPAFMTAAAMGLNDPSELEYPEVLSAVTVGPDSDDDVSYDLVSHLTDVNGTVSRGSLGTRAFQGTWVLLNGLEAEATSLLPTLNGLRGRTPETGDFILIGTGPDEQTEIATVQSVDGSGWLINRGMLDTVPQDWGAGARAFVIPASMPVGDETVRSAFEDVSYWFLTQTTQGKLALEDAPQVNVTLSDRPYKPLRPANVKVNGVAFGSVDANSASEITVTWANRNRTLESTQAMKWEEANVAGEAGQTTAIVVRDMAGNQLARYGGITGTTYTFPRTPFSSYPRIVVSAESERDGVKSLQARSLLVRLDTILSSAAAFVGTGTVNISALRGRISSASFRGEGQLSLATVGSRRAAFDGEGTFAASPVLVGPRSVAFTGSGSFAANRLVIRNRAISFDGSGSMTITYNKTLTATAAFAGTGTLTAQPQGVRGFDTGFSSGFK